MRRPPGPRRRPRPDFLPPASADERAEPAGSAGPDRSPAASSAASSGTAGPAGAAGPDGAAAPAGRGAAEPPAPRPRPSPAPAWTAARLLTALALLVSPFLPWARMRPRVHVFGMTVSTDPVSAAGVNLDGTAQVVPVLAVVAIVMLGWGALAAEHRIGMLAAVPAGLSLLACLLFLLRAERIHTGYGSTYGSPFSWPPGSESATAPRLGAELELALDYGWFLCLVAALLLTGLALTRR